MVEEVRRLVPRRKGRALFALLILLVLLAACGSGPQPAPTATTMPRPSRTPTAVPPSPTAEPSPTRGAPSPTAVSGTATSARRAAGTATAEALANVPTEQPATASVTAATPEQSDETPAANATPQRTRRGRTPTATPTVTATTPPNVSAALPATRIPLIDMGDATYFGYEGGLYPGGSNSMPAAHAAEGARRAALIQPLDVEGNPDPEGQIVLLSVGLSVTTMEFCVALGLHSPHDGVTCRDESFVGLARKDAAVDLDNVFFLNGAYGGQAGHLWDEPAEPNYDRISQELMPPLGISEAQVQVVWLKVVNSIDGKPTLPDPNADAYSLMATHGNIVRALQARYPNLQQVFITSRNYSGYTNRTINPEPYAYETGFAVKWLIEAQIRQMESGEVDPIAGDLDYDTTAPWLAWGPYIWADGLNPRSDGVYWTRAHFGNDGTHPSVLGRETVGAMLLDHFKTSPFTRCWFLAAHPPCAVEP
jgi:hypothetical protein